MELSITPVPLGNLSLSPKNVRKVDPGPQAHAELCALVATAGLIYPLCIEPHAANDGHYEVVAGGRRLAALEELAKNGDIPPDYAVPCRLVPPGIDPEELSIMENSHEPMHTADQVTAFNKLAAGGMAIPTIAQRFGVSQRTVERRLRLANIAPAVLDAYRNGEMPLDTLEAFALSSDQDHQVRVWNAVQNQYPSWGGHARSVRHLLSENRIASTHPFARYATKRAYVKAGGRITEDLFAEDNDTVSWYDDPEIVRRVATTRLEKAGEKLKPQWAWVETRLENPGHAYLQSFGTLKPQPTSEEQARLDEISTRIDAIYGIKGELTDEQENDCEQLEDQARTIRAAIAERPLSDEAKQRSGILLTLNYDGRVVHHTGLVRPDDLPTENDPTGADSIESPRVTRTVRTAKFYSDSHADLLRSFRGIEVQAKLATNFKVCFDIFTFQVAHSLVRERLYLYSTKPLGITVAPTYAHPALTSDPAALEAIAKQDEALKAARTTLNLSWAENDDPGLAYRAFCALKPKEKQAIFSYCLAQSPRYQLAFDSGCTTALEVAIEQLGTTPETSFRPRAETFWKKLRKGQILDIADSVIGPTWTDKHRKAKKTDLVIVMEQVFADPASDPDVPAQAHERIRQWSIPGFRPFDPDPLKIEDEDAEPAADDTRDPASDESETSRGASTPAEALPEFLDD